jgi:uncharacterized protein (TIGR02246 family)
MSRLIRVLTLAGVLVAGCQASPRAADPAADRAAIEKLSAAYQAAYLAGDAKAIAALYADDAVAQPAGESPVQGRAKLDAYFAAANAQPVQETFTTLSLVIGDGGDMAYEVGKTESPAGVGKFLTIYRKTGGQWRIAAESWSLDAGASGAAISGGATTGTYAWKGRESAGCSLKAAQRGTDSVQVQLECNRGAPSYNSGIAEGVVRVANGSGALTITEYAKPCALRMQFSANQVVVVQEGSDVDCGFGHGVMADGTYPRTSSALPSFERDR